MVLTSKVLGPCTGCFYTVETLDDPFVQTQVTVKGNNLEEGIPPRWKIFGSGVNSGGGANVSPKLSRHYFSRIPPITAVNSALIYFPRLLSHQTDDSIVQTPIYWKNRSTIRLWLKISPQNCTSPLLEKRNVIHFREGVRCLCMLGKFFIGLKLTFQAKL